VAQSNAYLRGFKAGVDSVLAHSSEWAGQMPIPTATPTRRRRRTSGARGLPHATPAAPMASATTTKRRRTRKRRIAQAVNQQPT